MTLTESKDLKTGTRVCWRGNINDGGKITGKTWDAVTIAWDNHHVATVCHGDMQEVKRVK